MKSNIIPLLLLILSVVVMIYVAADYFLMDAVFDYWLFFIAILIFFLGVGIRSKSSKE